MTDDESLQLAIHEPVSLVQYDAAWPAMFLSERARLLEMFFTEMREVEHIGSTAIPGMPAKPIIDIMAGVQSMAVADAISARIIAAHYTTSAEFNATLSNRRWFMRWKDGRRTHHLHVVVLDQEEWTNKLRFRDLLRSSKTLAQRYALLKQELAQHYFTDREAYSGAKSEFVHEVIRA